MIENIADFFTHLGWAFWGQECDCGHNPFNGLARYVQTSLLPWTDFDEKRDRYIHWWQTAIVCLGSLFYTIGCKLYSPK